MARPGPSVVHPSPETRTPVPFLLYVCLPAVLPGSLSSSAVGVFLLLFEMFVAGDKRIIAWMGIVGFLGIVFGLSFAAGV